nr:MAG TPA: hypothetical protein [Caudoviricetes sp.]DAU00926.1 MAG TPA: hypothetical protein [Caudoviricetes sp.]
MFTKLHTKKMQMVSSTQSSLTIKFLDHEILEKLMKMRKVSKNMGKE